MVRSCLAGSAGSSPFCSSWIDTALLNMALDLDFRAISTHSRPIFMTMTLPLYSGPEVGSLGPIRVQNRPLLPLRLSQTKILDPRPPDLGQVARYTPYLASGLHVASQIGPEPSSICSDLVKPHVREVETGPEAGLEAHLAALPALPGPGDAASRDAVCHQIVSGWSSPGLGSRMETASRRRGPIMFGDSLV